MNFPPAFFVTGTDTGVGKTMVSAILTLGLKAAYWKPVQSGSEPPTDTMCVRQWTALPDCHFKAERFLLTQPLSPHASAAIDGASIYLADFALPPSDHSHLIIEGAGGVLVPLNEREMVIDLIAHLGVPALVVARSGLGTINHTTLTVNALRSCGIPVLGVVMNGEPNAGNCLAIEHYCRTPVLAQVAPLSVPPTPQLLMEAFKQFDGTISNLASIHADEDRGNATSGEKRPQRVSLP